MAISDTRWNEKRKFRRLDFHAKAFLEYKTGKISGEIKNISNMGAFLQTSINYSIKDPIDLTICFSQEQSELSVTVPCKVVRIDAEGVGLNSPHLEVSDLFRMELLLDLFNGDTQQLTREFCKFIST